MSKSNKHSVKRYLRRCGGTAQQATDSISCPKCDAKPGEPCYVIVAFDHVPEEAKLIPVRRYIQSPHSERTWKFKQMKPWDYLKQIAREHS